MEEFTKESLKFLNNNHTKVEQKEEYKGNYYSFITDTIYLAKDFDKNDMPKATKDIDKNVGMLIVTSHECVHSVQSKVLHIVNILFSNLAIITTAIAVMLRIFSRSIPVLNYISLFVVIVAMIVRLVLEIGAVNGSLKLAKELVQKQIINNVKEDHIAKVEKYMKKYEFLALLGMIKDKIVLALIILIIALI